MERTVFDVRVAGDYVFGRNDGLSLRWVSAVRLEDVVKFADHLELNLLRDIEESLWADSFLVLSMSSLCEFLDAVISDDGERAYILLPEAKILYLDR